MTDKSIKTREELLEMFERTVDQYADAEKRDVLGFPCAYMNGNMVCGLREDDMMLRLSESDRETFLELEGARPFETDQEEDMSEFVVPPASLLADEALFDRWLGKAFTYVSTLPDKPSRGGNRSRGNSVSGSNSSSANSNNSNNNNSRRRNSGSGSSSSSNRNQHRKKSSKKAGSGSRKKTTRKTGRRTSRNRQSGQT